jgi:hypothetical protein
MNHLEKPDIAHHQMTSMNERDDMGANGKQKQIHSFLVENKNIMKPANYYIPNPTILPIMT